MMDPLLSPADPAAVIDELAPDIASSSEAYARRFAGPVGRWFLEVQTRTLRELLRPFAPGMRVLDVGGGHAQVTPVLLQAGFEVVVLGSAPACAERLAPWLREARCVFTTGSMTGFPFADGSFDVAVSFRMLSHLRDWKSMVREMCRVSRRAVVLDYASRRSANLVAGRLFEVKRTVEKNTRPFTVFRPREIGAALAENRFRVAAARTQYLFPMALYRMLGSAGVARGLEGPARALGLTALFGSPVVLRADAVPR